MNTHRCPKRGCDIQVPNAKLACREHWYELSASIRAAVLATARYSILHPARRAALDDAREEWNR